MGFSGSGNSKNIVNAFQVAKDVGAKVISISKGNGGKSHELADVSILIPGTSNFLDKQVVTIIIFILKMKYYQ